MNEDQKNTTFQYTYSAKEQDELKRIRNKYLPKEENKMELLRRMDAQVTQKATMHAIIVGVIGALVLGMGMSCCLVWADSVFVLGMGVLALAYPIYSRTIKKERERITPEVLRLTEDLMK